MVMDPPYDEALRVEIWQLDLRAAVCDAMRSNGN